MATRAISILKKWFSTGAYPTEAQFSDVFDSYRHKSEAVPMAEVEGLPAQINAINDDINAANGLITSTKDRLSEMESEMTGKASYTDVEQLQTNLQMAMDYCEDMSGRLDPLEYIRQDTALQYHQLPTEDDPEIMFGGKIVQYLGETNEDYVHGHFYEGGFDDFENLTWTEVEVSTCNGGGTVAVDGCVMQLETLPTDDLSFDGKIVQYIGEDDLHTNGYFYRGYIQSGMLDWAEVHVDYGVDVARMSQNSAYKIKEFCEKMCAAFTNQVTCFPDYTDDNLYKPFMYVGETIDETRKKNGLYELRYNAKDEIHLYGLVYDLSQIYHYEI